MTVKDGSEGREKYRSRTITNTLEPVWSETAVVAMPDVNGLLLLVRKIWLELDSAVFYFLFFIQFRFFIDLELVKSSADMGIKLISLFYFHIDAHITKMRMQLKFNVCLFLCFSHQKVDQNMFINVGNIFQGDKRSLQVITQEK